LVWQLNDLWPATSWALVDVHLNRKPSFYITSRALAKTVVGMDRIVTGAVPYIVTSYPLPQRKVEVWAINGHLTETTARLTLSAFDVETGEAVDLLLSEQDRTRILRLEANQTTEIVTLDVPRAETTVMVAYLDDEKTGERLARWVDWPQPLKFIHFSKHLSVQVQVVGGTTSGSDTDVVTLSTNAPVKGVMLSVSPSEGGEDAIWDDNFIDLVPGEEVHVKVTGLAGRQIQTRWLCDWELEEGFTL
jgi:beta-mannosidase